MHDIVEAPLLVSVKDAGRLLGVHPVGPLAAVRVR